MAPARSVALVRILADTPNSCLVPVEVPRSTKPGDPVMAHLPGTDLEEPGVAEIVEHESTDNGGSVPWLED